MADTDNMSGPDGCTDRSGADGGAGGEIEANQPRDPHRTATSLAPPTKSAPESGDRRRSQHGKSEALQLMDS